MTRASRFLVAAAVLQGGLLSAPASLTADTLAFVESRVRAVQHRVVCHPVTQPPRAARRIIAI